MVSVKTGIIGAVALLVAILWAVFRSSNGLWILQDILGICFMFNVFHLIQMPSFKVSTIFLVAFFLYDIFFVFITPFFTTDGQSVMARVATRSDTGAVAPMTLVFPRIHSSELNVCGDFFSILGYGDIIMPGLVISYTLGFDKWKNSNRLQHQQNACSCFNHHYFVTAVIFYVTGLTLCVIALGLMHTAQPALLYIVPSILLSTTFVAWRKNQLNYFWIGPTQASKELQSQNQSQNERDSLVQLQNDNDDGKLL